MPLPEINLDDRKFQDIVDQAKRMIPRYTPEWTDHNVSDPGVALIELFAWMTEMVLYRTNRLSDKILLRLLDMIGARLEPPRAAFAPITFYLSAAQPSDVLVPEGTEVATVRTETSEAIVFSTEETLRIQPPNVIAAFAHQNNQWVNHDLRQLGLEGNGITVFGALPQPGDAFYFALESDHSDHVLALEMEVQTAGGAGVDPTRPPLEWQVWQGNLTRWVACELEHDGTGGFNTNGEVILRLPKMLPGMFQGLNAHWLRVRLSEPSAQSGAYKVSPELTALRLEARGGTVQARHAVTVTNEYLGESEGTPGQRFQLMHTPILGLDDERDHLLVQEPGLPMLAWTRVTDFANSQAEDAHFTLDNISGVVTLGPVLPQPTGDAYAFGRIPPKGSELRFSRYRHGGGVVGNLPRGALTVLKSSIPYVARVVNDKPARGGLDAQPLEDALRQAPAMLRARNRAVTADDFEFLAGQVNGVARVKALGPSEHPGRFGDPKPGQVFLLVIPEVGNALGRIAPEALVLPSDLQASVLASVNDKCLLGTTLEVKAPQYVFVSVTAKLRPNIGNTDPTLALELRFRAEEALYHYINPLLGGPSKDGWAFGRDLHLSELYAVLQGVQGVEFVEALEVGLSTPGSNMPPTPAPARLTLAQDAVVVSDVHRVTVL